MDTSPNPAHPAHDPAVGPAHGSGPGARSWQDNLLDVLRARERMWFVAAILLILLGALLALLAPGTLPPTLVVGAAVGLAAVLLATALVIGLDASDLIVRGERHVAAAGGAVAGHISRSTSDIDALVRLIEAHAADGGKVRVALTPASRSAGVPGARANIVAAELAARGDKVLVTDLTRGGTPAVGLSDVISGDRKLADAVRFDEELYLAHLAVGSEPERALEGFASWAQGLPPDLDVLVAALPPLSEPGVLPAVQGVELVLLLVEVDRTERVDLIASLDAIDAAGVPAELVLVDATTSAVHDSASPTVEVLSTPGSAPRQQDPGAFELADEAGVRTVPAPTGRPAGSGEPVVDDTFDGHGDALDDRWDDEAAEEAGDGSDAGGMGTVPAPGAGPGLAGAATAAATSAAAGSDRDQASPSEEVGAEDRRAEADDDYDDYELDDPPVMEPGGGHVRTMRRRGGSATQDTVAMPPVGREPPSGPESESLRDEPGSVTPGRADEPAPEPAPEERVVPEPAPEEPAPEPAAEERVVPEPAPEEPAPEPAGHDATEPEPVDDEPGADGDADDEDPIDQVAREQARLSASLQQLADDVWQRGND